MNDDSYGLCEVCGELAVYDYDPYLVEIRGDESYHPLCAEHFRQSADEI